MIVYEDWRALVAAEIWRRAGVKWKDLWSDEVGLPDLWVERWKDGWTPLAAAIEAVRVAREGGMFEPLARK